jgi:hypothetical protein
MPRLTLPQAVLQLRYGEDVKGRVTLWVGAFLQAKSEGDELICANGFGLCRGMVFFGPGWNAPRPAPF